MNEHRKEYVKLLVNALYDMQDVRKRTDNRIGAFRKQGGISTSNMADELKEELSDVVSMLEMNIEFRIAQAVKGMAIMKWLKKVTGIGTRYSGSLIGTLGDIKSFGTVSSLWAYCGMSVISVCSECNRMSMEEPEKSKFLTKQADRRWEIHKLKEKKKIVLTEEDFKRKAYVDSEKKLCQCDEPVIVGRAPKRMYFKGLLLTHNPFMKTTCWKMAGQFVRQGGFYRTVYEQKKEFYTQRDGDRLSLLHVENRARRATVKLFLSHLWWMWRKSEGLEVGEIYLQHALGEEFAKRHTLIKPPYSDIFD